MRCGSRVLDRLSQDATRRTQNHIWISDAHLRSSFEHFARASCLRNTSRRHGSSTPGPLEYRRRQSKRRMGALAASSIPNEPLPSAWPSWMNWGSLGTPVRPDEAWTWEAPTTSKDPGLSYGYGFPPPAPAPTSAGGKADLQMPSSRTQIAPRKRSRQRSVRASEPRAQVLAACENYAEILDLHAHARPQGSAAVRFNIKALERLCEIAEEAHAKDSAVFTPKTYMESIALLLNGNVNQATARAHGRALVWLDKQPWASPEHASVLFKQMGEDLLCGRLHPKTMDGFMRPLRHQILLAVASESPAPLSSVAHFLKALHQSEGDGIEGQATSAAECAISLLSVLPQSLSACSLWLCTVTSMSNNHRQHYTEQLRQRMVRVNQTAASKNEGTDLRKLFETTSTAIYEDARPDLLEWWKVFLKDTTAELFKTAKRRSMTYSAYRRWLSRWAELPRSSDLPAAAATDLRHVFGEWRRDVPHKSGYLRQQLPKEKAIEAIDQAVCDGRLHSAMKLCEENHAVHAEEIMPLTTALVDTGQLRKAHLQNWLERCRMAKLHPEQDRNPTDISTPPFNDLVESTAQHIAQADNPNMQRHHTRRLVEVLHRFLRDRRVPLSQKMGGAMFKAGISNYAQRELQGIPQARVDNLMRIIRQIEGDHVVDDLMRMVDGWRARTQARLKHQENRRLADTAG